MTTNSKQAPIREIALDGIILVMEKGEYSHKILGAMLEKYQYLEKRDRAFLTRLYEGTIERALELDYIINQFSKVKVNKLKPLIRNLLRMSIYQLKYMDAVHSSAACNEAVKLAKKRGFTSLSGFVNGVLRAVARNIENIKYPDLKEEPIQALSVAYSMPEWIISLWNNQMGAMETSNLLEGFQVERSLSLRINLNKVSVEQFVKEAEAAGIHVTINEYLPYAVAVDHYNHVRSIPGYQEGWFVVQDVSSMMVAEAAAVKPGDYVIDVCAAPGGKTLHIAQKLASTGTVDSRDISYAKTELVMENVKRLGVTNVKFCMMDATVPDTDSIEKADIVIADVPCSGLGVLNKKNDIKYKMSKEQVAEIVSLQRRILDVVVNYVKPGGTFIFSTCTINQQENEENVKYLIQKGLKLDSLEEYLPKNLNETTKLQGYVQLLPSKHQTDGFFIARLIKR